MTNGTSWKSVLSVSLPELWVLRIAFMVFIFAAGFGFGLFYTQGNFEKGLNYMQSAYTHPGSVLRVVASDERVRR